MVASNELDDPARRERVAHRGALLGRGDVDQGADVELRLVAELAAEAEEVGGLAVEHDRRPGAAPGRCPGRCRRAAARPAGPRPRDIPSGAVVQDSSGRLTVDRVRADLDAGEAAARVERAVVRVERVAGGHQRERLVGRVVGLDLAELAEEPQALRGVADEVHRHGRGRPRCPRRTSDGSGVSRVVVVLVLRRPARGLSGPPAGSGRRRRTRSAREQRARTSEDGDAGCGSSWSSSSRGRVGYRTMIVRVSEDGPKPSVPPDGSSVVRDERVLAGRQAGRGRPRPPTGRAGLRRRSPSRSPSATIAGPVPELPGHRTPRTSWPGRGR